MAHAVVTDAEWEGDPARRRSAWVAACVASTSTFLFVVDSGLIALSLPGVHEEFPGTARATLAWIGSGFLVAQSSLLLIGGRLGDRRGRKRYFLFGLFLFSLGALLTALAPTVELIIAARVLQGVGAAFLTSSALALVLPMFPSRMAPMVVGVWGSVGAVGACIAPTLGAMVIEVDWRWGFGIVAPIGSIISSDSSNSIVRFLSAARPSLNPTGPGSHAAGQGFRVNPCRMRRTASRVAITAPASGP